MGSFTLLIQLQSAAKKKEKKGTILILLKTEPENAFLKGGKPGLEIKK